MNGILLFSYLSKSPTAESAFWAMPARGNESFLDFLQRHLPTRRQIFPKRLSKQYVVLTLCPHHRSRHAPLRKRPTVSEPASSVFSPSTGPLVVNSHPEQASLPMTTKPATWHPSIQSAHTSSAIPGKAEPAGSRVLPRSPCARTCRSRPRCSAGADRGPDACVPRRSG